MKNTSGFPIIISTVLLAIYLSGCHPSSYYASRHFYHEEWPRQQIVVMDVVPSQTGNYLPTVWIRHSTSYPYQDFHGLLAITHNQIRILSDTLHLVIADSTGKWKGQGTQGLKTIAVPLPSPVRLDSAAHYIITFRHLMTDDTLPAIRNAGISFKPQKSNH